MREADRFASNRLLMSVHSGPIAKHRSKHFEQKYIENNIAQIYNYLSLKRNFLFYILDNNTQASLSF